LPRRHASTRAAELAARIAEALDLPGDYFPECRERDVIAVTLVRCRMVEGISSQW
jgi:hypothetical protein